MPGPASSEVEHSHHKIIYSGEPSSDPASNKKTPRIFHAQILHKLDPDSMKNVTGILNLSKAPSIGDKL